MDINRLAKSLIFFEALAKDAKTLSDEDAREELLAAGENPDEIGENLKSMALNLVVEARKKKLEAAKYKVHQRVVGDSGVFSRNVEKVRARLVELAVNPDQFSGANIAVNFRNGKEQSDSDILSLWQDLVDLGAVSDDDLEV